MNRPWSDLPKPGCIFEHYGNIPASVYTPKSFNSPLEKAVYENNVNHFDELIQSGHSVSIELKIGDMTCLEYAAMKGYSDILNGLIKYSICASVLQEYFSMEDMVPRAFLISHNKQSFFEHKGLAEANRYVSATYTAVMYDKPRCLELLLQHVKRRDIDSHSFLLPGNESKVKLSAAELANALGHTECYSILKQWEVSENLSATPSAPHCM